MKKSMVIGFVLVLVIATGVWARGYYLFRSYPEPHDKGYPYSASLACKGGQYMPFVKGYENRPDPVDNEIIQQYVETLNSLPENGKPCSPEHHVLEGTWRPFLTVDEIETRGYYLFGSYSESHENGYPYTASLACKGGYFVPFVKAYDGRPDPKGHREIQEYVRVLNEHPLNGTKCYAEHMPLEGTWKPFYEDEENMSESGGGGCFITTAGKSM